MKITEKTSRIIGKRFIVLTALIIGLAISLNAQNATIKGKLLDNKTKDPIAFAHVLINNTKHGTITDINGNFSINTNISHS